jgi:hypothetical protein
MYYAIVLYDRHSVMNMNFVLFATRIKRIAYEVRPRFLRTAIFVNMKVTKIGASRMISFESH